MAYTLTVGLHQDVANTQPCTFALKSQITHQGQKNDKFSMVAVYRHRGPDVVCAAGDVAAHLCVEACTQFVNNEFAFAWGSTGYVRYADVRPTVKLTNDLVIA